MDMVFLGQITLLAAKVCLALTKYSPSHATILTISLQVLAHNVLKIKQFQHIRLSRMSWFRAYISRAVLVSKKEPRQATHTMSSYICG